MPNPTAAMLVIGDEILSGRTRDGNTHYLAVELTRHGIALCEGRVVADDHAAIIAAVRALSALYDHVFTSGGIGPTHDDITADAIAAAFDAPIGVREDARALLESHYARAGLEFNAARQRMARIPDGAILIENPVSTAPGFTLGNVHVMAGVPNIFQAMVASVLPTLTGGEPLLSQSLRVSRGEGEVAEVFGQLAAAYPDLSMGSYPFVQNGAYGTNLVVRGSDAGRIAAAMTTLSRSVPGYAVVTDTTRLHAAGEATWPPAATHVVGGITVRDGRGGGNRVSAATGGPAWSPADIAAAETAMKALGQSLSFMIRQADEALDHSLADRGYRVSDATIFYAMPLFANRSPADPMAAFPHWPPLAIAAAIWGENGIGPERLAIMDRVAGPRAVLLGRSHDHPAGVAFVAIWQNIACLHALVVPKNHRRQGAGAKIVRIAADWAADRGAEQLVLAVTAANAPARALYASLGMEAVGQYHYRVK